MKLENATRFDRTKNYLLSKPRSILETNARPRFQFSAKRSVSDREIGIIGATNERSVESALKAGGGEGSHCNHISGKIRKPNRD